MSKWDSVKIEPEWIDWLSNLVAIAKEGAFINMPLRGVIYHVKKNEKKLIIFCQHPKFPGTKTDVLNRRIAQAIGYQVEVPENIPTDFKAAYEEILKGDKVLVDNYLLEGMRKLFSLHELN